MARTETFNGTITRNIIINRFEVHRFLDGTGKIIFGTFEEIKLDGVTVSQAEGRRYEAQFADLPPTFPVVINGNTVQVAGSTILAALGSVADAVITAQA